MKDLAAGLNAKFKFTYTSFMIFVACDAEPVTRGIGSGGVMHTSQIKPVHAVHTHPALCHGTLFGWLADLLRRENPKKARLFLKYL